MRSPFGKKTYKGPVLAPNPVIVKCTLSTCIYHGGPMADASFTQCSHPDKRQYMENPSCPLYRLDWQKQQKQAQTPKP